MWRGVSVAAPLLSIRDVSAAGMIKLHTLVALFLCAMVNARAQKQPPPAPQPTPSTVYAYYNPDAIADYKDDAKVVRRMVERLVLAVTGQTDLAQAWRSLVAPNDKVGIKISAAGGEFFTTHHSIVNAIVEGL